MTNLDTGRSVLLAVDDDPSAVAVLRLELTKRYGADYDVRCEVSATAALRLLEALAVRAYEQAWLFGAKFHFMKHAATLRPGSARHTIALSDGTEIVARTVVLATGVTYRRLERPGLDALVGAGVFYGAAASEALSAAGQQVFVAGGGSVKRVASAVGEGSMSIALVHEYLSSERSRS